MLIGDRAHWLRRGAKGGYAASLAMVAAATACALLLARSAGTAAADLIYLLPVLAAASLFGLKPGLLASFASALAYNFFFTEPVHSFRIDDPQAVVTVVILLIVAGVTSQLAARMRRLAGVALESAELNETLVGFARQLLACGAERQVGEVTCREVSRLFAVNAMFLSNTEGAPEIVASHPSQEALGAIDRAAAGAAFDTGETSGRGSGHLNAGDWTFYPLKADNRVLGLLGLARDDGREAMAPERRPLLGSILDQAALALERARLEAEMLGVAQLRERDRLRGALLSSVGHDLRTPLTAILAAAQELRRRSDLAGEELLLTLEGEARRLDRLIANLLDMVRVEAGAIRLNLEAVDLTDAVASAAHDVRRSLDDRAFEPRVPADLPLVTADPQLLHHCLINLLDNAARHSPAGGKVTVAARLAGDAVELAIGDEGPGIPAGMEEEIFERFTRLAGSDSGGGTGLGLAIVKGFAEAMGAEVRAGSRASGAGAEFILRFPPDLVVALPAAASA